VDVSFLLVFMSMHAVLFFLFLFLESVMPVDTCTCNVASVPPMHVDRPEAHHRAWTRTMSGRIRQCNFHDSSGASASIPLLHALSVDVCY
jgi:hypothetical protein